MLEIVVRALFGERLAARASELGELFQRPQDYLEGSAFTQFPHPLPAHRAGPGSRADRDAINAILDEQIAHIRAEPSGDPLDVLEALVVDGSLTDDEIRDQVRHPHGRRLRHHVGDAGVDVLVLRRSPPACGTGCGPRPTRCYGPLAGSRHRRRDARSARLDLANRVMRETTRLHPAGVVAPREAAVDVVVGGYRIPKGTLVLASAYLAGRDEAAWDEPLRFDPDRFVDPPEDRKALADIAWVPFSRGARNCIGFALAQMELTLIVARLAQRLDIEATAAAARRGVGIVVNRPEGGAPMRVRARQPAENSN